MQEPFALFQVSEFLLDLCTLHKPQRKFKTMLSLSLHYLPSKNSHFFLPWFHTQFHDFPPLPIEEDPWAKASLHYLQNENPFFFFFFLSWFHAQFYDFSLLSIGEDPWAKASLHYLPSENHLFLLSWLHALFCDFYPLRTKVLGIHV